VTDDVTEDGRNAMSTLRIEHTDVEGTLLDGTSRGDGTAEVVKTLGWRWSGRIGLWYLPRSRARAPQRALIEHTAAALREAGYDVEVDVDEAAHDRAELEARRAIAEQQRAERLAARAERHTELAEQADAAGRAVADRIPLGQPILLGHHSQRRAERDRDRIGRAMSAAATHTTAAQTADRAAQSAAGAAARRHRPVTVANRVQRLEAQIRKTERALTSSTATGPQHEAWVQRMTDQLTLDRADLDYWAAIRAEQLAAGIATNYGPGSVAAGDLVQVRGRWLRVVRANPKTVTLASEFGNGTTPWHEVQAHRRA
jgi:Domain of unknown function (DUF3560)